MGWDFCLALPCFFHSSKSGGEKGVIKIHVLKVWYLQVVRENADVASVSGAGVLD